MDYKSKDLELWSTWKRTQSPTDLQRLLDQMEPIVAREVNRWANSMSRSLLEAEGKRLAVEAFKTYDPKAGTALSTYVASRLPKLSRLTYANMNAARMSETQAMLFHTYNTGVNALRDDLGREPTHDELMALWNLCRFYMGTIPSCDDEEAYNQWMDDEAINLACEIDLLLWRQNNGN